GEDEDAVPQRRDARAALRGRANGAEEPAVRHFADVAPARHHDEVRLGEYPEAIARTDLEAARRAQRPLLGGRKREAIGLEAELRPIDAEDGRHRVLERPETVVEQADDERGRRHDGRIFTLIDRNRNSAGAETGAILPDSARLYGGY